MDTTNREIRARAQLLESEARLLGTILVSAKDADRILTTLEESHFLQAIHRLIFKALKEVRKKGEVCEINNVARWLENHGHENVFPEGITCSLMKMACVPVPVYEISNEIAFLKKGATARNIQEILNRAQAEFLSAENPFAFTESLEEKIRKIRKTGKSFVAFDSRSISKEELLKEAREERFDVEIGLTIGKTPLALHRGSINVVAGATGHGKTTFLINMALKTLERNKEKSILFFSYEEPKSAVVKSFLNSYQGERLSNNNLNSIKSFYRDKKNKHKYFSEDCDMTAFETKEGAFFKELCESRRIGIIDERFYVEDLCSEIEDIAERDPSLCCVFIDYFQLISLRNVSGFRGSRQEELKKICLMLSECAKRVGLPFVIGSQFNRKVVDEATLTYTNISEAGDIERIASLIIGFWNRNFLGFGGEGNKTKRGEAIKEPANELYVEVLKGRHIGTGMSAVFGFDGNISKIDFDKGRDVEKMIKEINEKEENKNTEMGYKKIYGFNKDFIKDL